MTHAQRVLVLGGTSSGKSSFAERLLTTELATPSTDLRYLATGREDPDDPDWQARIAEHRARRGERWHTVDCGDGPELLLEALADAPEESLVLVDDLGGWVGTLLDRAPASGETDDADATTAERLAQAVHTCAARAVVVVSPEVGLSVVPATRSGRLFTDLLGACNRAVADVCGAVALVVAGRALWLPPAGAGPLPAEAASAATLPAAADVTAAPTVPEQAASPAPETDQLPEQPAVADVGPAEPDDEILAIRPPDRVAINAAEERLVALATGGTGLGALAEPVAWAVGASDRRVPWTSIRVVLVGTDHGGGAAAGDTAAATALAAVDEGTAPLARLAERAGAAIVVADLPAAGFAEPAPAMESGDVLSGDEADRAFALGRELADRAADEGVHVLVPAACGAGVEAACAAALAGATGSEPAGLLGRVVGEAGRLDDEAWIARCVAARDALHRIRHRSRDARSLLAMVGGADLSVLTGLIIGAAIRHLPVLVDNPATAAAMLLARDLAPSSPWWCLVPDSGRHPTVRLACDLLGMEPFLDLGLGLGSGTTALTAVGVLQPALVLAAALDGQAPDEDAPATDPPASGATLG